MPQIVKSLDALNTQLDPTAPRAYLNHVVASTLQRRGFQASDAEALTEVELLLEHHVQNLFRSANVWANCAGRSTPNAHDMLTSMEEQGRTVKRMKKESRRRRKGPGLEILPPPPFPPSPPSKETLSDLIDLMASDPSSSSSTLPSDQKPSFSELAVPPGPSRSRRDGATDKKLDYAYDGAPSLPGRWTYARMSGPPLPTPILSDAKTEQSTVPADQKMSETRTKGAGTTQVQVTPASLAFVMSTVAEQGIDPELGVVHYRRRGKRKWQGTARA